MDADQRLRGALGRSFLFDGLGTRQRTYKPSNLTHRGFYDLLNVLGTTTSGFAAGEGARQEGLPGLGTFGRSPASGSKLTKPHPNATLVRIPPVRVPIDTPPTSDVAPATTTGHGHQATSSWSQIVGIGLGMGFTAVDVPGLLMGRRQEVGIVYAKVNKQKISWPMDFRHVAHASTAEEAQYLLMRWATDGMGKVANPAWAREMRENVRRRAEDQQARAIAQVLVAREQGLFETEPMHTLRVVNGLPSSIWSSTPAPTPGLEHTSGAMPKPSGSSNIAGATLGMPSPATPKGAAAKSLYNPFENAFRPIAQALGAVSPPAETPEETLVTPHTTPSDQAKKVKRKLPPLLTAYVELKGAQGPEHPADVTVTDRREPTMVSMLHSDFADDGHESVQIQQEIFPDLPARLVIPSLPTLEKAASTAVYFETLYWAILKPPQSLDSAPQGNYVLSRERRRIALEDEMQRQGLSAAQRDSARRRWQQEETWDLRSKRQKVDARSFKKLQTIGHGAFGVVSLVKDRTDGRLYAMKELRKKDMLQKGQEAQVRAERDLLAASQSPWIVKLYYSFQDTEHLYLVLAFEGGGDLLNLLVERDTFDEKFTKFYAAEMILALEATHKLGYIHRDIKPDNFLFSSEGHIRVADFGLATDLHWAHDSAYFEQQRKALLKRHGIDLEDQPLIKRQTMRRKELEEVLGQRWLDEGDALLTWRDKKRRKMAFSVCGTNSYMSPEVIRGQGYGVSCDWWSLGVIVFECLYGYPPFVASTRHVTRQKILDWRTSLKFPPSPKVSKQGIDFIARLLCEPEDRLGAPSGESSLFQLVATGGSRRETLMGDDGASRLKLHPWFTGIEWDNLERQTPPYRPNLRHAADTRNFDDDIPAEPLAPAVAPPKGTPTAKDPMLRDLQHGEHLLELRKGMAFAGWTYKATRHGDEERKRLAEVLQPSVGVMDSETTPASSRLSRSRALSL